MKIFKSVLLGLVIVLFIITMGFRINMPERDSIIEDKPAPLPEENSASAEESPEPTPEPTPTPTPEPEPEYFTISVIGDCTLYSHQNLAPTSPYSYTGRMGEDFAYSFSNTAEYFENDDFTISNLECNFSDKWLYSESMFHFLAPTAYAQILLEGGVDFVTTANNHIYDFGQAGAESTFETLESYGIPYGKEGEAKLFTTDSGLKIGIYCDYNYYNPKLEKCLEGIESLKEQGAEYIIMAFHWGDELTYKPAQEQIDLAHSCIDAGADLIYGSHTHTLQPIEEYNGGLILYSMGNWSFGGHTTPTDSDTAIVQLKIKRDLDGSISRDGVNIIPCCLSSLLDEAEAKSQSYNDYRPTPYPEDSPGYERVVQKLTGSFEGKDGVIDYTDWFNSYG